jgi:hypothetical protein
MLLVPTKQRPATSLVQGTSGAEGHMKRVIVLAVLLVSSLMVWAAPLATSARNVIPKDVQQIICVDYRSLKASPTALALKDRVLPPNLREFENTLRSLGLDPDKDVESLTFASFRTPKQGLQIIGIAQGTFPEKKILQRLKAKKIKPSKYHDSLLYPASALQMSFLDDFTLLFGENNAIRSALDARDGYAETLSSNAAITDMINSADSGTVWSVLDQAGTQNVMRSALGEASQLGDYDVVKKRLLGARYAMDFTNGVKFDLDVLTSDALTATMLSSLVKAGMMYRRLTTSNPTDKLAIESMSVDSESDRLRVHFKTDDKKFQSLLQSDLFAAVSR